MSVADPRDPVARPEPCRCSACAAALAMAVAVAAGLALAGHTPEEPDSDAD